MSQVSLAEFAQKIGEIMPLIVKEFVRREPSQLYKAQITLPQFLILGFLYRGGEAKMTALANFMHVSTAAMTGIVDRLVRDGYVIRIGDPFDRRITKIRLTTKGSQLLKKINEQRKQTIIKIFGKISECDRRDYLRILMQIKDVLSREDGRIK